MNEKQKEQLEKFKTFTRWMYKDSKEAMFCAEANFLIAMGIFNYIETLGAFLIGKKKKNQEKFESFFSYLDQEYKNLLKLHHDVYKDLRCGLTHEYLPKEGKFCIYGTQGLDHRLTDEEMDNCLCNNISGAKVNCGVIFLQWEGESMWQVFLPKLLIDFEKGVKKLIKEIEEGKNEKLMKIFFKTADQINLRNF